MKFKSFRLKLVISYVLVVLLSMGFIIFFLQRSLNSDALAALRGIVLPGLIYGLASAFVLGSMVAASIIKPVKRMISVSRKYAQGDFSRRIIKPGDCELGELAATLNTMAQEIEDKVKEVQAQNQKLAATFNSMIEGVMIIDASQRVITVNPTIERIFAVAKKKVEGRIFLETIRNASFGILINQVLGKRIPVSAEIALSHPRPSVFEVNAAPIFEAGQISGCLVVVHDITEIRRLETVRSDFVANVSHELKTPLTSIKGFVETLLDGALDDQGHNRDFVKIIQGHAERLSNLVDDLLSLAHLESQEIALDKHAMNLSQLCREVVSGFSSQIKKRNLEIINNLPSDMVAAADRNRMLQVLTNLVDNAIKFNKEKGWIKLEGRLINGKIEIIVEDSGIGIPQKDIPRIFERFYRVDKARSRELGGTGLGLSIVKHIVELHKGAVAVESTEGLGSKFSFTIPQ